MLARSTADNGINEADAASGIQPDPCAGLASIFTCGLATLSLLSCNFPFQHWEKKAPGCAQQSLMSYATFEDEEAQLPPPTKPTCSIRRVFSVALVVTVGLVYAAASGARHATPLEHFIGEETYVCYYQDRCYALYKIPALCQAAAGQARAVAREAPPPTPL